MGKKEDEFLHRLRRAFKTEASERIASLTSGLLDLEQELTDEQRAAATESFFREAHSLKGAARAVNLTDIESLCQSMENVLAGIKKENISPPRELLDTLHAAVELLARLISFLDGEKPGIDRTELNAITARLAEWKRGEGQPEPVDVSVRIGGGLPVPGARDRGSDREASLEAEKIAAPSPDMKSTAAVDACTPSALQRQKTILSDTVRISASKLESLFLQVQEMVSLKINARQRVADLNQMLSRVETVRKGSARSTQDMPASPLPASLDALESGLRNLARMADHDQRSLAAMVDYLIEDMKKVLMLPFSLLLEVFPVMVRDLSREQGKEADLIVGGGEIEMDRRILEEMKDPLIHLVRNAVDHGIEKPDERSLKGKPRRGLIRLDISRADNDRVELLVRDDGAGIDAERVREAALKRGLISRKEADGLDEKSTMDLIFRSEVSTSGLITNISGRGLGLAIVKEKVETLGGSVFVETSRDKGSTFRMIAPLTIATFRGALVRVGDGLFVVPTSSMERVSRVHCSEVKTVENMETIAVNGKVVSLVYLADVLELPRRQAEPHDQDFLLVVVLGHSGRSIAFAVDEVLDEQEVLVKSLGRQLSRVRNIAGATVLGTGKTVPILNVQDLMRSAAKAAHAPVMATPAVPRQAGERTKRILVVEDSITSRTLLKNILESAGYHVKLAVDGLDGFTQLRSDPFDLVVSDVEMPRMNGFQLTARIRADKDLSELPVVLVTALASREDREKGIDVGANAYIVKSSFDQSDLLDVLRRLI